MTMRPAWAASGLVREAFMNLASARVRTVVLGAAISLLVANVVFLDTVALAAIQAEEQGFRDRGGLMVQVRPGGDVESTAPIPGSACALAARELPVSRSGHVSMVGPRSIGRLPHVQFQTVVASPAVVSMLSGQKSSRLGTSHDGVVVGAVLAKELGVQEGDEITVDGVRHTVEAVLDFETRYSLAERWLLFLSANSPDSTECWFEVLPGSVESVIGALPSWFAGSAPVDARPLEERNSRLTLAGSLGDRPEQYLWIGAVLSSILLCWIGLWFRRSELALYRLVGAGKVDLWFMQTIESAMLLVPCIYVGTLWGLAIASWSGSVPDSDTLEIVLREGLAIFGAVVLVASLPVAVLRMNLQEALKEG